MKGRSSHWQEHTHGMTAFIDNYLNCHLLYHNQLCPQQTHQRQLPIVKQAFANLAQLDADTVAVPFSLRSDSHHNIEAMDCTLGPTEEDQYSNYLKEYQTVIKSSRRKEYVSPEKHNRQIKLLIDQFLSDVHGCSQTTKNSQVSLKTPHKTPPKAALKPDRPKLTSEIKVEKVDLTAFQSNKSNIKPDHVQTDKNRPSKVSLQQKQKKQITKFIDISDVKMRKKQPKSTDKSKEKCKIEVKVKQIKPKQQFSIVKHNVEAFMSVNSRLKQAEGSGNDESYEKKQHWNTGNYSQQYRRRKHKKESRVKQSGIGIALGGSPPLREQQRQRKPIKIEIQIPEEEVYEESAENELSSGYQESELDLESAEIIKEISDKILRLLNKTKRATHNPK